MTQREIRQFVVENFLFGQDDGGLSDEDSMMDMGVMDSTNLIELIVFLEEKYRIRVEDEDLTQANLDSVSNLVCFVEAKLNGSIHQLSKNRRPPGPEF